ncbi:MAG TPA: hypothetical protein VK149_12230 [Sideroxyarcus sp.]|nr:hypothetical protein [Sideroxyarcus sp.]
MGREALAKAVVASSLGWDENQERQIDRVTALGMATRKNELGAAIVHAEALDESSIRKVVLLVARHVTIKTGVTRSHAEKVTTAALQEHLKPRCRACGGIPYIEARVAQCCPSCGGTGLHRYGNMERRNLCGGKYNEKAYEAALNEIRDRLGAAVCGANGRLE